MDKQDKFIDFIQKNFLNAILFGAVIAYLFLDYFTLDITFDVSWYSILGIFTIHFAFGYCVTNLLQDKGMEAGMSSQKYIDTLNAFGNAKIKTDGHTEFLQDFCDRHNDRARLSEYKIYFSFYHLDYKKVFNHEYDLSKLTKEQIKAIKKANKKISYFAIRPDYLLSLSNRYRRKNKKPEDLQEHLVKRNLIKIANRVITGIAFTLIAFNIAADPTWANFVSSLIKVFTWLLFGAIGYAKEMNYIKNKYLPDVVVAKTDLLIEFEGEYEKGVYKAQEIAEKTAVEEISPQVEKIPEEEIKSSENENIDQARKEFLLGECKSLVKESAQAIVSAIISK